MGIIVKGLVTDLGIVIGNKQEAEVELNVSDEDIMGAVARGWCSERNEKKTMDSALALDISGEVIKLLKVQNNEHTFNKVGEKEEKCEHTRYCWSTLAKAEVCGQCGEEKPKDEGKSCKKCNLLENIDVCNFNSTYYNDCIDNNYKHWQPKKEPIDWEGLKSKIEGFGKSKFFGEDAIQRAEKFNSLVDIVRDHIDGEK